MAPVRGVPFTEAPLRLPLESPSKKILLTIPRPTPITAPPMAIVDSAIHTVGPTHIPGPEMVGQGIYGGLGKGAHMKFAAGPAPKTLAKLAAISAEEVRGAAAEYGREMFARDGGTVCARETDGTKETATAQVRTTKASVLFHLAPKVFIPLEAGPVRSRESGFCFETVVFARASNGAGRGRVSGCEDIALTKGNDALRNLVLLRATAASNGIHFLIIPHWIKPPRCNKGFVNPSLDYFPLRYLMNSVTVNPAWRKIETTVFMGTSPR